MKKEEKKFIGCTMGMLMNHRNLKKPTLLRCDYYSVENGVELHAVNGHSLTRMKCISTVLISKEEYNDRDFDCNDDGVEFFWAMTELGCY